jgi:hypothetical protein
VKDRWRKLVAIHPVLLASIRSVYGASVPVLSSTGAIVDLPIRIATVEEAMFRAIRATSLLSHSRPISTPRSIN